MIPRRGLRRSKPAYARLLAGSATARTTGPPTRSLKAATVIVKINDVGPLKPGRVIDLNQQTMYYFDPSLQHGLVFGMMITPLPGDGWVAGPVKRPMHRNVVDVALANKLARMAWTIHTAFLTQSAD